MHNPFSATIESGTIQDDGAGNITLNLQYSEQIEVVETPAISPDGGFFEEVTEVTLSCATSGAEIRYTTDGGTPSVSSQLYTAPFNVAESCTVKAKAFKSGMTESAVASAGFVITLPDVPTSGLTLHLKADEIVGLSDGNPVSQWNDDSGNNNHAVQATSNFQPTYKTNILNGKPVVRFDGLTDFIQAPNGVFNGVSNACTIIAVFSTTQIQPSNLFRAEPNDQTNVNRFASHFPYPDGGANNGAHFDFGNYNAGGRVTKNPWGANVGQFYIWGMAAGNGMELRRNGAVLTTKGTSSTFSPNSPDPKHLKIGTSGASNHYHKGDIAEFIMWNRHLTEQEIGAVEEYLSNKYGITLT